jgi:two-component system, OmpR family, phosphate regulon sensor histidine kinase PhoR
MEIRMAQLHPGDPGGVATSAAFAQFAELSTIFDAIEVVLYVADMDTYELLFLNDHGKRLWGADTLGRPCHQVLQSGQCGPCTFCTNARLVEEGRAGAPVVWEFRNTVNERWYLCIDKAIPWTDGRLVRMEVAIDITERKAHEQFREQYVGLISHDLRSPLSGISFWASALKILLEKHGITEGVKPIHGILDNARRMAGMIDDLLETTRLESGQFALDQSRFDLNELAGVVIGHLGAEACRPIRLEMSGPAPVVGDPARLERVVQNLVSNAIRYSPRETAVAVRVCKSEAEVVVTVTDCGVGIPADELPLLFQRFYRVTTSRGVNGLGLGLYNSRLIIESHGGRIWAESELGTWSTFGFALPLSPGE